MVGAIKGIDPNRFIYADALVGSPGLLVPAVERPPTLDAHEGSERPRAEIGAGRRVNSGIEKGAESHAMLHALLTIKMKLVGVVVRICGECGRNDIERLDTAEQVIVDQGAVSDFWTHVWPRHELLRPLVGCEYHVNGNIPVGVAVRLNPSALNPLRPGVQALLRVGDVAAVGRIGACVRRAERHGALGE